MECLRILRTGRSSAVKAHTAAVNQIKGLLVSAPDGLRAKYRGFRTPALITTLCRARPSGHVADPEYACLLTLKSLALRCQSLTAEITAADAAVQEILDTYAPLLCDLPGVGTEVASQMLITVGDKPERVGNEAQFASLVGVAPIPASSGKTTRHRLSRGLPRLPWHRSRSAGPLAWALTYRAPTQIILPAASEWRRSSADKEPAGGTVPGKRMPPAGSDLHAFD